MRATSPSAVRRLRGLFGLRWTLFLAARPASGQEPAGVGLVEAGKAADLVIDPANPPNAWNPDTGAARAPCLECDFKKEAAGDSEAVIPLLLTFRLYPGMKLRLAVALDGETARVFEVPGSSGTENETGPVRENRVELRVPFPQLAAGAHTLKIQAVDSGAVLDEIVLP